MTNQLSMLILSSTCWYSVFESVSICVWVCIKTSVAETVTVQKVSVIVAYWFFVYAYVVCVDTCTCLCVCPSKWVNLLVCFIVEANTDCTDHHLSINDFLQKVCCYYDRLQSNVFVFQLIKCCAAVLTETIYTCKYINPF